MTLPVYSIFAATTHEGGRVRPRLDLGGNALENYGNFLQAGAGFSGDVTALSMMWNSFLLGAGFATLKVVLSLMTAYALIYFRVRFASAIFAVLLLTSALAAGAVTVSRRV